MGTYVIFGSTGSIGSVIAEKVRMHAEVLAPRRASWGDVRNRHDMEYGVGRIDSPIDGVIYAVGRCPPNGFPNAIRRPLSELPMGQYANEIDMHQIGVLNVYQCLLAKVRDGGCFVFLSSAITRFKGTPFPSFLNAYHHASVIAAEDWLIDGMRQDPAVTKRGIKIHRIAPAAVDTPFHHAGPKPPKLIPIDQVVEEVLSALASDSNVDAMLL